MSNKCSRCGHCCQGDGYVFLRKSEIKEISEFLNINKKKFLQKFTAIFHNNIIIKSKENKDCIFLENNSCIINQVKPLQCFTWPFWSHIFQSEIIFNKSKKECSMIKNFTFNEYKKYYTEYLSKNLL